MDDVVALTTWTMISGSRRNPRHSFHETERSVWWSLRLSGFTVFPGDGLLSASTKIPYIQKVDRDSYTETETVHPSRGSSGCGAPALQSGRQDHSFLYVHLIGCIHPPVDRPEVVPEVKWSESPWSLPSGSDDNSGFGGSVPSVGKNFETGISLTQRNHGIWSKL